MSRKLRLVDCNPKWGRQYSDASEVADCWLTFDCPEGHKDCWHQIAFTPGRSGAPGPSAARAWDRVSGTTFEDLTLSPSYRRTPIFRDREHAIAEGCLPEFLDDESLYCAMHVEIINGTFQFSGDSK